MHRLHNCNAIYVRNKCRTYVDDADTRGAVQACDPQNFEPNLALNLEITDLINSKKGTA